MNNRSLFFIFKIKYSQNKHTPFIKGVNEDMKTIKELKEDIKVIKDCRRRVRKAREAGLSMNTKFLAYAASVPEWTIVIFNRK